MAKMNLVVGNRKIIQDISYTGFCLSFLTEKMLLKSLFYFLSSIAIDCFSNVERILREAKFDRIISLCNKKVLLKWFAAAKEGVMEFVSSTKFRMVFIFVAFLVLIYIRLMAQAFGFSLGYLYLTLICLSGFWFGFKGGIVTATVSSLIFLTEISIFRDWPLRDVVTKSFLLRICFFYVGGLVMAYFSKIEKCLREAQVLAHYDELTGCTNYRWLMEILNGEINRCKRYGKEMTVIIIDIDHFKNINDTYGHMIGNLILRSFADVVRKNVRNVDIVGRYGGEEFLIILPEANHDDAKAILERIKDKLLGIRLPYSSDKERMEMSLHFSAGISSFPLNGKTLEELINAADGALYQAKQCGRDTIIAERRRWIRVKPVLGLKLELVKDTKKAAEVLEILNISRRGMLLVLSEDVKGRDVTCRIHFSEDEQPFDLKCEIVHKEKADRGLYLIGIYFEELPKQAEEKILTYRDKGDYA